MADFHRLIRSGLYFLVGVMLSAVSVLAYAETPVTQYVGVWSSWAGSWVATYEAAGVEGVAIRNAHCTGPECNGACSYSYSTPTGAYGVCGGTLGLVAGIGSRSWCVDAGVASSGGSCPVVPSCPAAGTTTTGVTGGFYTGAGSMPATLCISGCTYSTQGLGVGTSTGWGLEAGKSTGATCTNAPPSTVPPEDPKAKCMIAGQGFGTVNGQVVCVAPTTTTAPKTTTTTSPGGNSTTNQTTNTTCTGAGSCTTTTTTTTTSGGSGPGGTGPGSTTSVPTTTQKDLPKSAFCEENPNSSMCKNSSFAGTCGSPPACDGDAVQCAQAKASFETKCLLEKEPEGAAYTLGKSIAEGGSDSVISPLHASQVETRDIASIISSAAGQRTLSASCIPSQGFTIGLGSYSIDTVLFCSFAQIMGYLFVAVASVHAVKMLAGGSV